ncbi:GNAT family N-acetyltransferase [Pontiellaceae bacterium B12219]|nr:GNAT family N-acetyltransferase [Pontiellaceae bacterium B12219]
MKKEITIRYQQMGDAKRFYEILNSPNFTYFPSKPKTIKEQKDFLRRNKEWREKKQWFNFSVLYGNDLVGAVGIHMESHRPYCGEVGYFVDEAYWGKGIAVQAVRLIEEFAFEELSMIRKKSTWLKRIKPALALPSKQAIIKKASPAKN